MKSNLNIAICDDSSLHCEEIRKYISQYSTELKIGAECVEFLSGGRLLESEDAFDVLFLDIEMSGINGIEVMSR